MHSIGDAGHSIVHVKITSIKFTRKIDSPVHEANPAAMTCEGDIMPGVCSGLK